MPTIRRSATFALLAAFVVLMTGCLKAQQHLTLNADDTIDGTVTVAVSQQLIDLSGSSADDVLDQITEGDSPVPEGVEVDVQDYDEDGFVGKTFTFEGASIDQINDQGDLTIEREGDVFVVDGQIDLSTGPDDPIDLTDPATQGLLEDFDVSLSVTFPGEVTEHDGSLDGTTVTWTPAFGEQTTIHAEGSAIGDGGSSSAMTWILIALAVVLIVVVVAIVISRGRGSRGGGETPMVPDAATPVDGGDAPPVMPDAPVVPEPPSPSPEAGSSPSD